MIKNSPRSINKKTGLSSVIRVLIIILFIEILIIILNIQGIRDLKIYNTSLVTISITISIFSINFSFLQYQFSPYRQLVRVISLRQRLYSMLSICISLVPLFVLFCDPQYVPAVSLFVVPLLAFMTLFLWGISNQESSPLFILERQTSNHQLDIFFERFEIETGLDHKVQSMLQLSKPGEEPLHNYGELKHSPISISNDPFRFTSDCIDIAIKNSDLETYDQVIKNYFSLIVNSKNLLRAKGSSILQFRFTKYLGTNFSRISNSVSRLSDSKIYQSHFLYQVGKYLKEQALEREQVNELNLQFIEPLTDFACYVMDKNSNGSLFITSLYRELAQKGIYDLKSSNDIMFGNHLAYFPNYLKIVGQTAVKLKDSDTLFRCLEDLGWLGATAIKGNSEPVGKKCLQSLVQLGREARSAKMKCFWESCMLDPIDHADERIFWMLSHIPYLNEDSFKRWLRTFETAYSRLRGNVIKITMIKEGDNHNFYLKDSKENYIEPSHQDQYSKQIDYSDFSELKEFKLY